MAITKTTTTSIKDASVEEANINNCAATNTKLGADAVTSAKINNGTVTADDLASTLDLSSKTLTLPSDVISFDREYNNIGLLGFKMAVNESLTVFNLVDGVVDEFNDESGTDEGEGTNDNYCASSDFYTNQQPACISAGFSLTTITEPDTSVAGTNPAYESGSFGTFTVPSGMTSASLFVWGAGGGTTDGVCLPLRQGGGGGYSTGNLAVSSSQVLHIGAGEGGKSSDTVGAANCKGGFLNGGGGSITGASVYDPALPQNSQGGSGGGLAGVFAAASPNFVEPAPAPGATPQIYMIAGSGGAGHLGGAGGGTTGLRTDGTANTASTGGVLASGGGGSQTVGGQGGTSSAPGGHAPWGPSGQSGGFLFGGNGAPQYGDGGGSGYYGGGGSGNHPQCNGSAGGGSSYIGNPQITCGSTTAGGGSPYPQNAYTSGGAASPHYATVCAAVGYTVGVGKNDSNPPATSNFFGNPVSEGQDGYVLITGSYLVTGSTTIVSEPFTSTSVPTTSRIVVFQENVDTPTLNTDIIASVSRDGTNFTNATLSDSGYITGSSGQRILTGQADISGQPSGQSMRWKLQLANNQVKIHGVSLSWA